MYQQVKLGIAGILVAGGRARSRARVLLRQTTRVQGRRHVSAGREKVRSDAIARKSH